MSPTIIHIISSIVIGAASRTWHYIRYFVRAIYSNLAFRIALDISIAIWLLFAAFGDTDSPNWLSGIFCVLAILNITTAIRNFEKIIKADLAIYLPTILSTLASMASHYGQANLPVGALNSTPQVNPILLDSPLNNGKNENFKAAYEFAVIKQTAALHKITPEELCEIIQVMKEGGLRVGQD